MKISGSQETKSFSYQYLVGFLGLHEMSDASSVGSRPALDTQSGRAFSDADNYQNRNARVSDYSDDSDGDVAPKAPEYTRQRSSGGPYYSRFAERRANLVDEDYYSSPSPSPSPPPQPRQSRYARSPSRKRPKVYTTADLDVSASEAERTQGDSPFTYDELEKEGLSKSVRIGRRPKPTGNNTAATDQRDSIEWRQPKAFLEDGRVSELLTIHASEYSRDEGGLEKITLICPTGPQPSGDSWRRTQMRWL